MNEFTLNGEQVRALALLLEVINIELLREGVIEVNPLCENNFTPKHGEIVHDLFYFDKFGITNE